ncbi:MAG TPA: hypothetical protein VJ821_07185 [Anaerolineales bacterium]|nr:hypothetical protein [Anaerolineales bacterium]
MGDLDTITKSFTRFFVPGIAFLVFAVAIPTESLGIHLFIGQGSLLGVADVILLSILIGYVLDSIKGYRWTFMLKVYKHKKRELARSLEGITRQKEGTNPDYYLAVLWKYDEETYNRIFIERAEWVMILETSFSLWVGGVALLAALTYTYFILPTFSLLIFILPILLFIASYLSAINGIDRMNAHNLKLIEALKSIGSKK